MIGVHATPEKALEYLRQLSWGNQMLWIIGALFSLQAQLEAFAKVANANRERR